MGPDRPNWVGLICWVLILGGFGGLVASMKGAGGDKFATAMAMFPYPVGVAEIMQFAPRALMVLIGILMYERQGWARYLYVALMPVFFVHQYFLVKTLVTIPPSKQYLIYHYGFYVAVLLYLVSIVVLFLPRTHRYYHPPMYIDE